MTTMRMAHRLANEEPCEDEFNVVLIDATAQRDVEQGFMSRRQRLSE